MAFGDSVKPSPPETASKWHEVPDYTEVRETFNLVGRLKAEIEILDIEIEELERQVKRGSRKADDIDAAKEASKDKRIELARKRAELKIAEYDLDFLQYRKSMFTSINYTNR